MAVVHAVLYSSTRIAFVLGREFFNTALWFNHNSHPKPGDLLRCVAADLASTPPELHHDLVARIFELGSPTACEALDACLSPDLLDYFVVESRLDGWQTGENIWALIRRNAE